MKWDGHRRWTRNLGIRDAAAEYVNRVIDVSNESSLPAEYTRAVYTSADAIATNRGAKQRNSALSLIIAKDTMGHDSGRRKTTRGDLAAECTLRHLQRKGKNFVNAWYLHHHLDYLHEQRTTGDELREVIIRYKDE